MRYEIEIGHSDPIWTAVVRSRVRPKDLSQFVPASCGEAWGFIRAAGIPQPGRNLALGRSQGRSQGHTCSEPRGCHSCGGTRLHRGTGHGMKRTALRRHLREQGCVFIREG
jgi:hypothetical protein